jgi:predicted RNA-binding Zn-ribbon protein involved in translation (DUF1610 family)
MSRWVCPSCKELHSTTGVPNEIEGYFIDDYQIMMSSRQELEKVIELYGKPAHRCPTCGTIERIEEDD